MEFGVRLPHIGPWHDGDTLRRFAVGDGAVREGAAGGVRVGAGGRRFYRERLEHVQGGL